jgi:hypothetical protein
MINVTGIASVVVFYILILAVGMWAARKNQGGENQEVSRSGMRITDIGGFAKSNNRLKGRFKTLLLGKKRLVNIN